MIELEELNDPNHPIHAEVEQAYRRSLRDEIGACRDKYVRLLQAAHAVGELKPDDLIDWVPLSSTCTDAGVL